MATYLVTGAAGFIGAKVSELLLAEGHTVVGIDNLNDYYDVRVKDFRLGQLLQDDDWRKNTGPHHSLYAAPRQKDRFSFRPLDVENQAGLDALFAEFPFDAVFNLSARAGVRYSLVNPQVYLATNALGCLNLLECVRRHGVKKFVLASTSSLYAGCELPFREDLPVNCPISPYAASKKAAEAMTYTYHHLYKIDVSILRYFTVYGPAGRPDMSPFRFIKWVDEGQPIELFGDGGQSRDFTFVDDIARGTIAAARPLGYEIINLGGGRNPRSIRELIATVEKYLGKTAVVAGQPGSPADMRETWADIQKAGRLLGWQPTIEFEEGIKRTVDWYLENKSWLKAVVL